MKKRNNCFKKFYLEISKYVDGVHLLKNGVEMDEIEHFEIQYGMYLPANYKQWLLKNNGGELFATPVGTSIAGILGSKEREKGTFYLEDNFDNKKRVGVPNYIFMIANTCDGNIIGFDLQRTNLEDGVVVYWNHATDELDEEWDSFEDWINEEMETGKMLIDYDGTDKDDIF